MRKGFTLVEIMIVIAIIALLSAIAIPNLLRARSNAAEANASSAMHTIVASEVGYRATHSTYTNLFNLGAETPPYIDSALSSGTKQGYDFAVSGTSGTQFYATGVPNGTATSHGFYVDEDGILCRSDNITNSAHNSHQGSGCPSGYSEVE